MYSRRRKSPLILPAPSVAKNTIITTVTTRAGRDLVGPVETEFQGRLRSVPLTFKFEDARPAIIIRAHYT